MWDLREWKINSFSSPASQKCISVNRELVGLEFLKSVPERFASSPDLGKITLLHLEFLLQNSRELLAKQKVEEIITGLYPSFDVLYWKLGIVG